MLPRIALIGRPNVGKSALFNRICQKRLSIVDPAEGITRDRLYARAELFGRPFTVIDTGGIDIAGKISFAEEVRRQTELAIEEADVLFFVVDGQVGVTREDEEIARSLRKVKKSVILLVNKMDAEEEEVTGFSSLGIKEMIGVSALHGHSIAEALEKALDRANKEASEEAASPFLRVAIVGRPNVGKSTLANRLFGEERAIVSPIAGTTRDALDLLVEREGKKYLFVDTAGVRRKKGEKERVDGFAALRTQEAIERAEVVLLVIDAEQGFTVQEMRLAAEIEKLGKSCILLLNKWDRVKGIRMEHALRGIREAAPFFAWCPTLFLSALQGRNVEEIFPLIDQVCEHRSLRLPTAALNDLISSCMQKYQPPMVTGKRLRIYYLTQVAVSPPRFVLFVNRPDLMTTAYRKFLLNQLRKTHPFPGTPLFFDLKGKSHKVK
ncbi:MAG: ribosome biogenesis GTPase Der [Verrucomicrobiota bacterium]|nr:ribosome biogenesis GTPase Der [Verrucomicrobiota bacterium]